MGDDTNIPSPASAGPARIVRGARPWLLAVAAVAVLGLLAGIGAWW